MTMAASGSSTSMMKLPNGKIIAVEPTPDRRLRHTVAHALQRSASPAVRPCHRGAILAPIIALIAITLAISLAAADARRYAIQTEASELGFKATSRLMNADGRFHRFRGDVAVDPRDLATARMQPVDRGGVDRHGHRPPRHAPPERRLLRRGALPRPSRSRACTWRAAGRRATVTGRLTVRGVTREIAVPVDVSVSDVALVASGELVMNRRDSA